MSKLCAAFCFLLVLVAAGCDSAGVQPQSSSSVSVPTPTASAVEPSPTVDLALAHRAFEEGGVLTYDELRALRHDVLGDPLDMNDRQSKGKYSADPGQYMAQAEKFGRQLDKCKLGETIGWIAYVLQDRTDDLEPIPGAYRLAMYMYDPYSGPGEARNVDPMTEPELYITGLTKAQVSDLKNGERIELSGDLTWINHTEQDAVKNAKIQVLQDDAAVTTPADLNGLKVTLDDSEWDHTIVITAGATSGLVAWEPKAPNNTLPAYSAVLSESQLSELFYEFNKADFFNLNDYYQLDASDAATYVVTIAVNGKSKRVQSHATAPRRLDILIFRIVQIANAAH